MASTTRTHSTPSHRRDRLVITTECADHRVVRITVAGEVDASNAAQLRRSVFRRAANSRHLALDLRGVTFFSAAGLATLHTIVERCKRANIELTLHCSPTVSRVLAICDTDGSLADVV
jgi:anti-anti-sigma factor